MQPPPSSMAPVPTSHESKWPPTTTISSGRSRPRISAMTLAESASGSQRRVHRRGAAARAGPRAARRARRCGVFDGDRRRRNLRHAGAIGQHAGVRRPQAIGARPSAPAPRPRRAAPPARRRWCDTRPSGRSRDRATLNSTMRPRASALRRSSSSKLPTTSRSASMPSGGVPTLMPSPSIGSGARAARPCRATRGRAPTAAPSPARSGRSRGRRRSSSSTAHAMASSSAREPLRRWPNVSVSSARRFHAKWSAVAAADHPGDRLAVRIDDTAPAAPARATRTAHRRSCSSTTVTGRAASAGLAHAHTSISAGVALDRLGVDMASMAADGHVAACASAAGDPLAAVRTGRATATRTAGSEPPTGAAGDPPGGLCRSTTFTARDGTRVRRPDAGDRTADPLEPRVRARRAAVHHRAAGPRARLPERRAAGRARPHAHRRLHARRERHPRARVHPGLRDEPLRLSHLHRQRRRADRSRAWCASARSTTGSPKASSCSTTCRPANIHNGSRVKFGPDGRLYVTFGDVATPSIAQDVASLNGKILRLNDDGTSAAGQSLQLAGLLVRPPQPAGHRLASGHRRPVGDRARPDQQRRDQRDRQRARTTAGRSSRPTRRGPTWRRRSRSSCRRSRRRAPSFYRGHRDPGVPQPAVRRDAARGWRCCA